MQSADCVLCSLQTAYLAPCSLQTAQVLRLHATYISLNKDIDEDIKLADNSVSLCHLVSRVHVCVHVRSHSECEPCKSLGSAYR